MRFLAKADKKIESQEEAIEIMKQPRKKIGLDIETVDTENKLPLGIGIAISPTTGFYFFDVKDELAQGMVASASLVAMQNAKFDLPILESLGYHVDYFDDTKLLAYSAGILDNSLQDLAMEILFKECPSVTSQWRKKNQGNVGIDHVKMGGMCITHACLTYALHDKLPKTELYYSLDKPCINLLMEMERWGLLIDQYKLTKVEQSVANIAFPLEKELMEELNVDNVGSNPQVAEALEKLGVIPTKKTKSKAVSVGEESLKPLNLPLTNKILKWRSLMKTLNTYVPAFRKVDANGRMHTEFGYTRTGRFSSKNPNHQNITRDEKFDFKEE